MSRSYGLHELPSAILTRAQVAQRVMWPAGVGPADPFRDRPARGFGHRGLPFEDAHDEGGPPFGSPPLDGIVGFFYLVHLLDPLSDHVFRGGLDFKGSSIATHMGIDEPVDGS